MRLGAGVEWGLHCCTLLGALPAGQALPAARLAEFHDVPAAYLAKHLQSLSRAGIIGSGHGPGGGYRLARPAEEISVLDVVLAIEGAEESFRCTEIRRRGPAGQSAEAYPKACGIARVMGDAEEAWRAELASHTVADLVAGVYRDISPEAARDTVVWLKGVLR